MSDRMVFKPIIGTDALIRKQHPAAGCVWFASDSKKIYYSDGNSFLSMGGNTGIYYGIKDIPEDVDSDQTDFTFFVNEIDGNNKVTDGNYKIPNVDDLILNSDGCFYRVNSVVVLAGVTNILTTRLTIAGGGGGGSMASIITIEDVDGNATKYFTKDATEALLRFKVSNPSAQENNGIAKITYIIGALDTVLDTDYHDFGVIEFDLLPYISRMTTSTYTTVTVQVEDVYGTKKSYYYYINVVELALKSDYTNAILMTDTGIYNYSCFPSGGATLNDRQIFIAFYDENNNHLGNDIVTPVTIANSELPIEITVPAVGAFTMTVTYRGKLPTGRWVNSNILKYQAVYYDENPQLVVNVPTTQLEQYGTLEVTYMVAAKTNSVDKVEVTLRKGSTTQTELVNYNVLNKWPIYFDTPGRYSIGLETLTISKTYDNIEVYRYEGDLPTISTNGLTLNLSAIGRSNNEVNRDKWISNGYTCSFDHFSWGEINGWMQDADNQSMLRLSAGATLTLDNFYPFAIDTMTTGQTIELDFKVSGVTDFSKGLIECLSYTNPEASDEDKIIQVGFQVTGQGSTMNTSKIKATKGTIVESDSAESQIYNTQIQGCTARFIEGERIHLTWTIDKGKGDGRKDYPMIKTYLNGVLSGVTQYTGGDNDADEMRENQKDRARIIFDSSCGTIDIYNIRIYQSSTLSDTIVLDNYIATCGSIEERAKKYTDNNSVIDNDNKISIETIEAFGVNKGYKLSVPYIKIIGGQGVVKDDDLGYIMNASDEEYRLPNAKSDYRLVEQYEFIDMNGQRARQSLTSTTSTVGESEVVNGVVMYGQGTSSMEYPVKNLRLKAKMRIDGQKVTFPVNDCNVDLVCLKADYMESSGSHNTGTGNLVYTLTEAMGLKTPGQEYWNNKVNYDVVSAIRGFPVMVFFKEANKGPEEPFEFIGKYNFNLDKATHEPFGFQHDGTFGWTPNEYIKVGTITKKSFNAFPFDLYIKDEDTYTKVTGEWDANTEYWTIANHIHCYEFLNNASNLANFLNDDGETFETTFNKLVPKEDKMVPNWYTSYESRYPEYKDAQSTDIGSWFEFCSWVNSTKNNPEKFKQEFNQHMDFDFTCFYYILTHVLLMIDSRAKNLMMATWDDQHWYPIFYDMDTMLGLNNYGYNKYHYDVEDTDLNIYNGQLSILWNNFRAAYSAEIREFYQRMQTAGLTYSKLLQNYGLNQADAVNEVVYNKDSNYKYIRPFNESFIDNSGDKPIVVEPGSRDYLYASQGSRSMHRKWWLQNRMNYFNGKYLSQAYKSDRYVLRIYTPQAGAAYYKPVGQLTEEVFNNGIYYIQTMDESNNISYIVATTYDAEAVYYVYESNTAALDNSLQAVPPDNAFTLTPLYNQYLSVAFGGDNGRTTDPAYVQANKAQKIMAPTGAKYNDTETYLYGGSMLKDLGDLSAQYLGRFAFPDQQTKLERLTLGNPHNDYYNPNFSALTIGSAAPYLKELEISNCSGLSGRSLRVDSCHNIQKIYATGTGLTGITLPAYGVLDELRLPETINSLTLISQSKLTPANFTIGTCSYNPQTKVRTYTNSSQNLISLRVEDTPIDTLSLIQSNPYLQKIYLKNFTWTLSDVNDLSADKKSIPVLDRILRDCISAVSGQSLSQSMIGTINFASSLGLTAAQALFLYEKYCSANVFPHLKFEFTNLPIVTITALNGNNSVLWSRKVAKDEKGQVTLTETILQDETFGAFTLPTKGNTAQFVYEFTEKWRIDDEEIDCTATDGYPLITIDVGENVVEVILEPIFREEVRTYRITFKNPYDSTFYESDMYAYGTIIETIVPKKVPLRSDENLDVKETYSHIGYSSMESDWEAEDLSQVPVSADKTYYAIFKRVSVYENIHYDYFNWNNVSFKDPETGVTTSGYVLSPNRNLSGKITIPATDSNKTNPKSVVAVTGFSAHEITHVFVEGADDGSANLLAVQDRAFMRCSKLRYFDFVSCLRSIGSYGFAETELQPNVVGNIYYFGESLHSIGTFAFNQINDPTDPYIIKIPSSVVSIGSGAFSFSRRGKDARFSIEIGDQTNFSKLDLTQGVVAKGQNGPYALFAYNDPVITGVTFYSANYSQWAEEITKDNAATKTVLSWLGQDNAISKSVWLLQPIIGKPDTITIP